MPVITPNDFIAKWKSVTSRQNLDAAVFAAYGWPADLSDDEILSRLLALNWSGRKKIKNRLNDYKEGKMDLWDYIEIQGGGGVQDTVVFITPSSFASISLKDYIKQYDLKDNVQPNVYSLISYLLARNWEPLGIGANEYGICRTRAFRRRVSESPG